MFNLKTWMITIITWVIILFCCSCECNYKDKEHPTNDTIKCEIINKKKDFVFDVTLNMPTYHNYIVIKYKDKTIKNDVGVNTYKKYNIGDSVLCIKHYCPFNYYEIKY